MVGVPKSKGCALCLKRSVKCDEARPSCSQCRRGGRTCPGYTRGMKFIDEGPKLQRSTRNSYSHKSGGPSPKSLSTLPSVPPSIRDQNLGNKFNDDSPSASDDSCRRIQGDARLLRLCSWKLERDQILSSFISTMFPLGAISVQASFLGSWLWHLPPRLGCSAVLDHAALSLAWAYFARVSGDKGVFQKAEISYTLALKSLAAALSDPRKRFHSDVLCATLLLGHYETFANVNHTWIKHAGGAARLMQLRGARRCYESAFEYAMFLTCRGAIISKALASREPCFLDAKEWRSIPDGLIEFPLLPKSPDLYHAIFGYFAAIPGLLSKVKLLSNDTPKNIRLSILSSANELRRNFSQWYLEYTSSDNGLNNPVLINVPTSLDDYPFDSVYVYKDVISASVITTYYAYLILLNREIYCLQSDSSYIEENFDLARAICMSIEYCLHAGYCGTQTMRFSLPIAYVALPVKYHGWTKAWVEKFSSSLEAEMILTSHP